MRNYSTLTEEELLIRLQAGNEDAFTEIYNRYWEKLLAIGYYHVRDQQAAEDIVHEVMISLWMRKRDLTINSLQAYLATAVKFAVFKSITRNKRRREIIEGQALSEHISDIEEKLDAKFLHAYMLGAIEELPEKARLVFNYSRVEELTISEIASKMDLSPKAVEYHMTKALRALRETLKKIKSFFI
ncbi:RNA polymerase sigma-70 factor [Chitinophagaceae bacterium LB-8]|uniref:RNA polymerase sigma-70 factor n=1 Tax=Paraflavisolibacter caeni TaxID=2982496 RepID=A0A9X2XPE5_9BACT|nr:RNA polymerase sigma-70 factor [Paraflavisolibacter caeni]MCU7550679.1 RNA polymerase sigma-70 factor [Paraflavisolibacter caeni]